MWALILTVVFVGTFWYAFSCLTDSWIMFAVLWYLYYTATRFLHELHWLRSDWWRGGPLARWVHGVADVAFTDDSLRRLAALDANGVYMFACEPHNPQCLHMALGFAAHAGKLPPALATNTLVVADPSAFAIPVVREVLSVYGVVDASRENLETLLKRRFSLAIVPSGIPGKSHALLDRHGKSERPPVRVYRRADRFGFLSLATRYGAHVVPVLSPDEPAAYNYLFWHWRAWPFVMLIGRYLVFPNRAVRFHVGAPIDTSQYDARDPASMRALADVYYNALVRLAPPNTNIRLTFLDDAE